MGKIAEPLASHLTLLDSQSRPNNNRRYTVTTRKGSINLVLGTAM